MCDHDWVSYETGAGEKWEQCRRCGDQMHVRRSAIIPEEHHTTGLAPVIFAAMRIGGWSFALLCSFYTLFFNIDSYEMLLIPLYTVFTLLNAYLADKACNDFVTRIKLNRIQEEKQWRIRS